MSPVLELDVAEPAARGFCPRHHQQLLGQIAFPAPNRFRLRRKMF